mgnify:FL=1
MQSQQAAACSGSPRDRVFADHELSSASSVVIEDLQSNLFLDSDLGAENGYDPSADPFDNPSDNPSDDPSNPLRYPPGGAAEACTEASESARGGETPEAASSFARSRASHLPKRRG